MGFGARDLGQQFQNLDMRSQMIQDYKELELGRNLIALMAVCNSRKRMA